MKIRMFVLVLFLSIVGVALLTKLGREDVDVLIPRGASLSQVSEILHKDGVNSFPKLVKILLRLSGGSAWVQAGEYRLKKGMGSFEAVLALYQAEPILHQVTIPEGWNARQISDLLASKGLVDSKVFLKIVLGPEAAKKEGFKAPNLEGYLFPDTYAFSKVDGEERIAHTMVSQFKEKWERDYKKDLPATGLSREEVVTLASIVEKETGKESERPLIASVFFNRLKIRMKLQSDPTTIYGIANFDGNLRKADLLRYSPYNTYTIPALPPGAIASPGDAAIRAVLHPATSKYLYFVSKNDGSHHFSQTYGEHARNVNSFQPIKKKRRSR